MTMFSRSGLHEGFEERGTLLIAKTAESSAVSDANLFHQPAGLNLADPGKRLEDRENLGLSDDLVGGRQFKDLGERNRAHLEPVLEISARTAGLSRLLQRCHALRIG